MSHILQNLITALNVGSSYALIALGYTMVYGVLRLINFAHGDVFMLGAFVGAFVATLAGSNAHEQTFVQAGLGIYCAMCFVPASGFRGTVCLSAVTPLAETFFADYGDWRFAAH